MTIKRRLRWAIYCTKDWIFDLVTALATVLAAAIVASIITLAVFGAPA